MQAYDAKEYWSKRLDGNLSLSGVGFAHFGESYNEYMYKMKRIVLERTISKYKIEITSTRILDLGCGSGFYVDIWHNLGVSCLVRIDITNESVKHLSAKYTKYSFYEADITSSTLINVLPFLTESLTS